MLVGSIIWPRILSRALRSQRRRAWMSPTIVHRVANVLYPPHSSFERCRLSPWCSNLPSRGLPFLYGRFVVIASSPLRSRVCAPQVCVIQRCAMRRGESSPTTVHGDAATAAAPADEGADGPDPINSAHDDHTAGRRGASSTRTLATSAAAAAQQTRRRRGLTRSDLEIGAVLSAACRHDTPHASLTRNPPSTPFPSSPVSPSSLAV